MASPTKSKKTHKTLQQRRVQSESEVVSLPSLPKPKHGAERTQRQRPNKSKALQLPGVRSFKTNGAVDASGEELEVLKSILVREGYLERLSQLCRSRTVTGVYLSETIHVLDLVRSSTVDVVESICSWRRKAKMSDPFPWNGHNYLLKIPSDLDFLDEEELLVQWLGFSLIRNPFILPLHLDAPSTVSNIQELSDTNYTSVGGQNFVRVIEERVKTAEAVRSASREALLRAERRRPKHAYETPVINDQACMTKQKEALLPVHLQLLTQKRRPNARFIAALASQIGEDDLKRMEGAKQVLLKEEEQYGRLTRNLNGRIVPEEEAVKERKMIDMSGDVYAAKGLEGEKAEEERVLEGNVHVQKKASLLGPVTKTRVKPVLRSVAKRSRGAQYKMGLECDRQMNADLLLRINRLREEIERKEMDIADFESVPGIELYTSDFKTYVSDARALVLRCRRELEEKIYIYNRKEENIDRKQEILSAFQETCKETIQEQRSARINEFRDNYTVENNSKEELTRFAPSTEKKLAIKQLEKEAEVDEHAQLTPVVHHMCAQVIQKMARGMITRAAVSKLRVEVFVSSKYIQAVVRGFLVRRKVSKAYAQNKAVLIIQRYARGMIARVSIKERRRQFYILQSVRTIQRFVRGRRGRKRMVKVRELVTAKRSLMDVSERLEVNSIKELAEACWRMVPIPSRQVAEHLKPENQVQLPLVILGLVRILRLMLVDSDDQVDVRMMRWREAAAFLKCAGSVRRRMEKVAAATYNKYLRSSDLLSSLVAVYQSDNEFHVDTFSRLKRGHLAATSIYDFIVAYHVVQELQTALPVDELDEDPVFRFDTSLSKQEKQKEEIERQENVVQDACTERKFVPIELLKAPGYPLHRRRPLLVVFAHDVPQVSVKALIEQLNKHLPGLFVHIDREKMEEESEDDYAYKEISSAVSMGYAVFIERDIGLGDANQRRFVGAFSSLASAIHPSPCCILVRGSEMNTYDTTPELDVYKRKEMVDAELKCTFERGAKHLETLSQSHCLEEIKRLSTLEEPFTEIVVVMEAVIMLLAPGQTYGGPLPASRGISWQLSRQLLRDPDKILQRIASVRPRSITMDNLSTLDQYVNDRYWPRIENVHGLGIAACVVLALAGWVGAFITAAHLMCDQGGVSEAIGRHSPVPHLFNRVVEFQNNSVASLKAGETEALKCLLDAVLLDVRVYRTSTLVRGRRCIVSIFQECQMYFFHLYDPIGNNVWWKAVPESDVDRLLSPNSFERADKKRPPKDRKEMLKRLCNLCRLDRRRDKVGSATDVAGNFIFNVRPHYVRLYQRTISLAGRKASITMEEVSRGRIRLDVFIHKSSQSQRIKCDVNVERILDRMSFERAQKMFIDPLHVPLLILDRLHLYQIYQTNVRKAQKSALDVHLHVNTQEKSRGRVMMRQAVRHRQLQGVWIGTLYQNYFDQCLTLELYCQSTSTQLETKLNMKDIKTSRGKMQGRKREIVNEMVRTLVCVLNEEGESVKASHCRRTLARFPCTLLYTFNPYQALQKHQAQGMYVQVERQDKKYDGKLTSQQSSTFVFRMWLPDTCEEHELLLFSEEATTALGLSSSKVSVEDDITMLKRLVSMFQWDQDRRRIVAALSTGYHEATLVKKKESDIVEPSAPVKAVSMEDWTHKLSCVHLLDTSLDEDEPESTGCYVLGREEPLHSASYRLHGDFIVVKATMQAQVLEKIVPCIPTDRVKEVDTFILSIHYYHPASSLACSTAIQGRMELRQVVGPDQAHLISSTSVHQLIQHIVTTRTELSYDEDGQELSATFLKDHVYRKQKATPITAVWSKDTAMNENKLIRQRKERGVKVASKAMSIHPHGRVILTAYNLRQEDDELAHKIRLRIDAYVCETSARLSLLLDEADLLPLVADAYDDFLNVRFDSVEQVNSLVLLVFSRVNIESRQDGTVDRLFIQEDVRSSEDSTNRTQTECIPLFKCVRQIGHVPVVVKISTCKSMDSLEMDMYDPQTSTRATLSISLTTLQWILGLSSFTIDMLSSPPIPLLAIIKHIGAFVKIHRYRREYDGVWTLEAELSMDSDSMVRSQEAFERHEGVLLNDIREEASLLCAPEWMQARETIASWQGMKVSGANGYCAVHLSLQREQSDGDVERQVLLCTLLSPSTSHVLTTAFVDQEFWSYVGDGAWESNESMLEYLGTRVCISVGQTDDVDIDMANAQDLWHITLQ